MTELTQEISKLTIRRRPVVAPSMTNDVDAFWASNTSKSKPTQLERYEAKGSPESIKKFIAIGGGPKMGTTLEEFARFRFKCLNKRKSGKHETGYDHYMKLDTQDIYVEQKSSGHWGDDDYKWQHVEENHKWTILLLCGIDYTDVKFWVMNRNTFKDLISKGKITNQGNKAGESSEGVWFSYSDVKDSLIQIHSQEQLLQFVQALPISA
jgi:hypothetical protein